MADAVPGAEPDPYVHVRAQMLARRFSETDMPRADWFRALAETGLTGVAATGDYRAGLRALMAAAETFGGYAIPLSFAPAAAAAAALAGAEDNIHAKALLADMLAGAKPVLPALQSGAKTMVMGAGGGLDAKPDDTGGYRVTGRRFAVPDAEHAAAFLAEAGSDDGVVVFLLDPAGPGVAFEALETVAEGTIGAFVFDNALIADNAVLARGARGEVLLDRMRFAVQLGLSAELSGLAAAMLIRAGAASADTPGTYVSEATLAGALMEQMLARAFAFGAAGLAEPCGNHALELIAGARAAASEAALTAARLVLSCASRRETIEPLVRRALVASRIYRQPQAHRLRFASWRAGKGAGRQIFELLYAAAGSGSGTPSAAVEAVIAAAEQVRTFARDKGLADDPVFRDRSAAAEIALCGLVCADAQYQAGADIPAGFVEAAARQVRQHLADCALHTAGSHAALAGPAGGEAAGEFIAAYGR